VFVEVLEEELLLKGGIVVGDRCFEIIWQFDSGVTAHGWNHITVS
jgi:hypothetical protein